METSEPLPPPAKAEPAPAQESTTCPQPPHAPDPPSRDGDAPPRLLPQTGWWPPAGWYVALYAGLLLALCLVRSRSPVVEAVRGALIFVVAIGYPESSRREFQPHPRYWWA